MDNLVEQLEGHAGSFKRIRRACEDQTVHAKGLVSNNETKFKQVKMSFPHLRSVLETDVIPSLNGMQALLNATR